MAEVLLRARLGDDGFTVASAGVGALVDRPADERAAVVMAEHGLDMDGHRARQLDPDMAREFDLLLVMEAGQKRWIEQHFPLLRGRVMRLGHWLETDIPDPYGQSVEVFRDCRELIERAVDAWVERLRPAKAL
jgi:protein-tyrosine phosphatase